jgi:glycosyltransferase involved in cell wall biosynthesis
MVLMKQVSAIKVAILATHPIQYHAPLWRKLAGVPHFDVNVFYGTDMSVRGYTDKDFGVTLAWDTPLMAGYASEFLSTDPRIHRVTNFLPSPVGVRRALQRFRPDVALLVGYRNYFHLGAWHACRRLGVPMVMRHEATDVAHARRGMKAKLRDAVLRRLYSTIQAFGVIGVEARRHLTRLGVEPERLFPTPYCIDTDAMAMQARLWMPQREAVRAELRIPFDATVFVFSGKLIEKKNPLLIVEAMRRLAIESADIGRRVHLVVAGDGPLMSKLREQAGPGIVGQAHFLGFLNQTELGRAYAASDALILPSRRGSGETWGLVVNEAMEFGLPALVSDGVGCSPDLVQQDVTGWTFPSDDENALAAVMRRVATLSPEAKAQMKGFVRQKIAGYSLEASAHGLQQAFEAAVNSSPIR